MRLIRQSNRRQGIYYNCFLLQKFNSPQLERCFSHKPPLSLKLITDRVLLVLKLYDKVNPDKVNILNALVVNLISTNLTLFLLRYVRILQFSFPANSRLAFHKRPGPGLARPRRSDNGDRGRVRLRNSRCGR